MTITPAPELVQQWENEALELWVASDAPTAIHIAARAAQWGADQELEACCKYMQHEDFHGFATELRAARRPKPLSLKQQSLALIDLIQGNEKCWDIRDLDVVRRALEALPDDRT